MTRTLDLLDRLIAFPTVSHASNLDLIAWAKTLSQDAGFEVTLLPDVTGDKAGLVARLGPDQPGGICLSGHTDVVPVEGQTWTRPSFRLTRDDARVFGRGTTDMKGFVASALALAERAKGADLIAPLRIVLSYDEEIGCVGIRDMLPRLAAHLGKPDLVIVGEPTSMQVATGHKGKAALEVRCHGIAGHSALAPEFLNAIHVASDFVTAMRRLQTTFAAGPKDAAYDIPYTTVHVGRIEGGRALNIVPDLVTLDMEYRHLPDVPTDEVLAAIESAARVVAERHGDPALIDIVPRNAYPGLAQPEPSDPIAFAQAFSGGAQTTKVAFGTEAGYFAGLGLNTVVIGPGSMSADGHKPDEGLDLSQLRACDELMGRVLKTLQG